MNRAIVSLLRRYLGSRVPEGKDSEELACKCPFHGGGAEETASFFVNTDTGLGFCHACHKGWNLYSLLRDLGIEREVIKAELDALGLGEIVLDRKVQYFLPEVLLQAYHACPVYMLEAGFEKEVLQEYEIGWDRINKRVTFPVRDHTGRLVGILGRQVDGRTRYITYKDELKEVVPDYDGVKLSEHVWNLDRLYSAGFFGRLEELIIVEGVKKALWLIQHGWENTVCLYGSHFSDTQHTLLSRLRVEKFIVMTDGDSSGRDCAGSIVEKMGTRCVAVPEYPHPFTQPDELTVEEISGMVAMPARRIRWRQVV